MEKKKLKKPEKAIKIVERWLKANCKKGELLQAAFGPRAIVLVKAQPVYAMVTKWEKKGKKKVPQSKFPTSPNLSESV